MGSGRVPAAGGGRVSNPYLIEGPAVISFSGGRTSGFMLKMILDAHGGKLPDDVRVLFANTGKEMPETLDFVEECSQRWAVPITWLEYDGGYGVSTKFKVVDYRTASRNGEPFALMIDQNGKPFLPNAVMRLCTIRLKIEVIWKYAISLGWDSFYNAIGIRADEHRRAAKIRANPSDGKKGIERILPLVEAGVVVAQVGQFWSEQNFDLQLPNMNGRTMHGNCDLCFLKGANQVLSLIREKPERALWWMEQERRVESAWKFINDGARFSKDRPSYAQMYRMATEQQEMFPYDAPAIEDCSCTD